MTREHKRETVYFLERIAAGTEQIKKPANGLCAELSRFFYNHNIPEDAYHFMDRYVADWPNFSGDIDYPIPVTDPEYDSPEEQYDLAPSLWTGRQGEMRRDLARHVANKLWEEYNQ